MGIDLKSPKLKDIVFNLVEVSKSVAQDPPTKLLALLLEYGATIGNFNELY